MKRFAVVGVMLALVCGGLSGADDRAPAGLDGRYKAVAMTRDGKDEPADLVARVTVKIAGEEMTITVKDKSFPAKITLNPKAKPAAIDIAPADGPEKGRTFLGIYKLEKGELLLAFREKGDRPTAFTGEDEVLVIRLKRDDSN